MPDEHFRTLHRRHGGAGGPRPGGPHHQIIPVAYDPEATCPKFDAFTGRFLPIESP